MAVADHSRTVPSTVAPLSQALPERRHDLGLVCSAVTQRPDYLDRSLMDRLFLYDTQAAGGVFMRAVEMTSGREPRQAVVWGCAFFSGVFSRVNLVLGNPLDHQLPVL